MLVEHLKVADASLCAEDDVEDDAEEEDFAVTVSHTFCKYVLFIFYP